MTASKPLTQDQIERAAEWRAMGMGWRKIARGLKASEDRLVRHFEPEKSIQVNLRNLGLDLPNANKPRAVAPQSVLDDRDRRLSIVRNPIADLLGDPLPGYSALDARA